MNASEIRSLSTEEIISQLEEARHELMNLRFQQATGELVNTAQIPETRHLIARLLTVLHERDYEAEVTEGEA